MVEEHRAARDGRSIAYRIHGDQPVRAVFVAGTGMSGAFWEVAQIPALEHELTCLVVDNAGTGRSDPLPDGAWTSEEMARDVLAAVRDVGWDSAHFIGQSLGSVICQAAADLDAERVVSLSLHSTWRRTYDSAYLTAWFEARRATAEARNTDLWARYAFFLVSPHYLQRQGLSGGAVGTVVERVGTIPPEIHIGHYEADLSHDASEYLPAITAPALVTVGSEDLVTRPALGAEVAQLIPSARFHTFPEGGHLACLESPSDFNAVQLAFIHEIEPSMVSRATSE